MPPSPTAGATIFVDPERTSPTAKTPGRQSRAPLPLGTTVSVTHGSAMVTLQQDAEYKPVRDQKQGYHNGWNEVGGAQLTWLEPDPDESLIERVDQICTAPDVEHPHHCDSQPGMEACQREQGQDGGNEIAVRGGSSISTRQVRRDDAGYQERQADEPEAVQEEERPQRRGARLVA